MGHGPQSVLGARPPGEESHGVGAGGGGQLGIQPCLVEVNGGGGLSAQAPVSGCEWLLSYL